MKLVLSNATIVIQNAQNIFAAIMNYGLGSDDREELAYYNKIKKDMDDRKKDSIKKGSPLIGISPKEWINEPEYFLLIDGSLMLIGLLC